MDPTTAIAAVRREVTSSTRDGQAVRVIVAERSYPSPVADVWDALTNPERIPRWLLPITGELRLGGTYQLEGNAGGTITACDPPRHLAATWEYGGEVSWVDVHLGDDDGDGTSLRLEHAAMIGDDDSRWDEFGPGAVGVGWDLSLLGLGEHLATGAQVDADLADPSGLQFMRLSSDDWCRASIASGTPRDAAEAAAARTTAAYTGG